METCYNESEKEEKCMKPFVFPMWEFVRIDEDVVRTSITLPPHIFSVKPDPNLKNPSPSNHQEEIL